MAAERITQNPRAILYMCFAMLCFGVADVLIRLASQMGGNGASSGQIMIVMGGVGAVFFSAILIASRTPITLRLFSDPRVLARTFCDLFSISAIVTAITLMEVTLVTAIQQIQPVFLALGGVFLFGERIGLVRSTAILVALIGVLMILRPSGEGVPLPAIMVLFAAIGMTGRDLLSRAIGADHTIAAMSLLVCVGMLPIGAFMIWYLDQAVVLRSDVVAIVLAGAALGNIGYFAITLATRIGEASVIAPFRYVRLPAAFLFAALLLGERPDIWTIIGSILVVVPGIVILLRERRAQKTASG